jgi:hypothetical protein
MNEHRLPGRVAVLGGSWGRAHDEAAFTARAVAAAVSRLVPVDVLVPGPPGGTRPDGAFDLVPVGGAAGEVACRAGGQAATGGGGADDRWPSPETAEWPAVGPFALAVVDDGDSGARALADRFLPGVPTMALVSCAGPSTDPSGSSGQGATDLRRGRSLAVGVGGGPGGAYEVGLHVPVHAFAAAQRHTGLGFADYVLVLGDRGPDAAGDGVPTALASWLATRFADRHVVVVENAVASVWRARSLRGLVAVDARADLWRLVANARMTVDLAPGPLLARECVESTLCEVPVVVPARTAGARLAARGGGLWFEDEAELLGCVEALDDQRVRDTLGTQGKAVATEWYGDAGRFVERVGAALAESVGRSPSP